MTGCSRQHYFEPRSLTARRARLILFLASLTAVPNLRAQIDPEPRQLLQFGYARQPDGRGPFSGYTYYYLNQPHFPQETQTLRLVVAPGYVDSELGFKDALGWGTDLGLGLAGGGFADNYTEIRKGQYLQGESFLGNGGKGMLSAYHDFPKVGPLPLAGLFRVQQRYSTYNSQKGTDPGFTIPPNQPEFATRAGLRLGGVEPVMIPKLGAELSTWYEGRFRENPGAYGYGGDRRIAQQSHLFWTRALLVLNRTDSNRRFIAQLTGGTSIGADRFSAYRLGGNLPMGSEYPLPIPGYFYQELSAQRYVLLGGSYIIPLCGNCRTFVARLNGDTAVVDYLPGLEQPGKVNTGVGAGLSYQSPKRAWQLIGEYGYGINAIRYRGRGGHEVGLFVQFDFRRAAVPFFHPAGYQQGLDQLLHGTLP